MKRLFSLVLALAIAVTITNTAVAYATQETGQGVSRGGFMKMLYETHVENGGKTVYQQIPSVCYGDIVDEEGNVIQTNVLAPGMGFGTVLYFDDVNFESDCYVSTGWGMCKGIVNGVDKNSFSPDNSVTREQAAVILYRYSECMGIELSVTQEGDVFSDADAISSWAIDAVNAIYQAEMMEGKSANCFDPKGILTKPEAATVLNRLFSASVGIAEDFTYNGSLRLSLDEIEKVENRVKTVTTYEEYAMLFPDSNDYGAIFFDDKYLIIIAWWEGNLGSTSSITDIRFIDNKIVFHIFTQRSGNPNDPVPEAINELCFTYEAPRDWIEYEIAYF